MAETSLNHRMRMAQRLREQGTHTPVYESSAGTVDFGKNLPKVDIPISGLPGMTQEEADAASESAAAIIQNTTDYGTIPFYFTPAAPLAGSIDISRGLVTENPIEMSIGMWGVSRPLQRMARTIPLETEKLVIKGGSLGALPFAIRDAVEANWSGVDDFLVNLGKKIRGTSRVFIPETKDSYGTLPPDTEELVIKTE